MISPVMTVASLAPLIVMVMVRDAVPSKDVTVRESVSVSSTLSASTAAFVLSRS